MSSAFALNNNRAVLEILHNSFRFGAPNEAVDDANGGATEFSADSINAEYFAGLFSSIIIMSIVTIIWLCVMPCAGCCCKEKCFPNQMCAKSFFFFSLFWSIIGFFISTGGISDFDNGARGGFDTLFSLADEIVDTTDSFENIVNVDLPNLQNLINTALADCGGEAINSTNIPEIEQFETGLNTDDVLDFFGDFDTDVLDAQVAADVFITPLEGGLSTSVALTIIYLIIFMAVTAMAFTYDWKKNTGKEVDPNGCLGKASACNKTFGCPIFTVCGIIIVLTTVSGAGIIGVIATLGADQCVPSLREDILAIVSGDINPDIDQMCGLEDLDGASDEELTEYFTCHYLVCAGEDLFLKELNIEKVVNNGEVTLVSPDLDQIVDGLVEEVIAATNISASQECIDALEALEDEAARVANVGLQLFQIVTCENLTPFWIDILDTTLCNELIAGLGVIYISWLLGAIALMFALCAYPAITLYEPNQLNGKGQGYVQPHMGVMKQAEAVAVPVAVAQPQPEVKVA